MDHPPNLPHQLHSPRKTFYYRNLFIFPLTLAFIAHSLFFPLPDLLFPSASKINRLITNPLFFQFCYPISLFVFPLLSNIIINSSAVSNPRLLITHYLWASLTMYAYNAMAVGHLFIILTAYSEPVLLFASSAWLLLMLLTDDVSLWRFMGSVFEPVSTVAAVKNSSRVISVVNGFFMYLFMGALLFPEIEKKLSNYFS